MELSREGLAGFVARALPHVNKRQRRVCGGGAGGGVVASWSGPGSGGVGDEVVDGGQGGG